MAKCELLLCAPEGQTTSESRHLSPPVQESSYGSALTPAKRPKRKVTPKRRQERPVAPPKKRRRKVHRMDPYAVETRQDKVSLSVVPKLCGGQVWVEDFLQCLGLKIVWISFRKTLVCCPWLWVWKDWTLMWRPPELLARQEKRSLLLSLESVAHLWGLSEC